MSPFAEPTNSPPTFAGVRAAPGQKYAVEWVKKRLRAIHREAPLKESDAHLYLIIATYVLDRRFISESMRLKDLVGIMHCDSATVTRARKRLQDRGELKLVDGGQGKADVRFALLKMAGPLYVEDGGAGAVTSCIKSEVPSRTESEVDPAPSCTGSEVSPPLPAQSGKLADAYPLITLEEEERSSTTDGEEGRQSANAIIDDSMTVDEQHAALHAAIAEDLCKVDEFCTWWAGSYSAHNGGVQNRVRPCDRDAAELLTIATGHTLDHLQTLGIELWTLRGTYSRSDLSFIRTSDRSIRVLLHKATVIEREVVRLRLCACRRCMDARAKPAADGATDQQRRRQERWRAEELLNEQHAQEAAADIYAMLSADRDALKDEAAAILATLPGYHPHMVAPEVRERFLRKQMIELVKERRAAAEWRAQRAAAERTG